MLIDTNKYDLHMRALAIFSLAMAVLIGILCAAGCSYKKEKSIPAAPVRTEENKESARQVAGVIKEVAVRADARGLVAKSTESGTLVRAADANLAYVGVPAATVSVDDARAVDKLLETMARQEESYRLERAKWEDKIDELSRDRDNYRTEVSVMGAAMSKLKSWLFWGSCVLIAGCVLCPGLFWFLLRFVGGRAKAHVVSMVEAIEEFRNDHKDVAPKLETYLSRKMDKSTKALVKRIKYERQG